MNQIIFESERYFTTFGILALFYQVRLIAVHNLDWDAIQEGLGIAQNVFL
ncbi:MAG: hypothetical protein ABIN89_15150 [Chitinophagaceae bacterium]